MRLTIFTKLFISLFSLSAVLILLMSLSINYSFKTGFQSYLNNQEKEKAALLAKQLINYYDHGWSEQVKDPRIWRDLLKQIGEIPLPLPRKRGPLYDQKIESTLTPLANRITLIDSNHQVLFGPPLKNIDSHIKVATVPLIKNKKNIGWLKIGQKDIISGPLVESFYQQQQHNLYWIIALAGLTTLFITALLVRHFLRPLKALHKGAKSLSDGLYDEKITIIGKDEFAELGHAFNALAANLKSQKKTRQQWITDISHELRTPIAVLQGELEAIQDGIRKPELKYIDSMHNQTLNLSKLVNDLYLLSQSDSGILDITFKPTNLVLAIDQIINDFSYRLEEKGLTIKKHYDPSTQITLSADQLSLQQLMINLLENSLRYTDALGQIHVSIIENADVENDDQIKLIVEDSAPTVNKEQLPRLFDRLYRVDQSRSRALGGSGLGLSICQNIVQQHQGSICAYQSSLGGIKIEVLLKKQKNL